MVRSHTRRGPRGRDEGFSLTELLISMAIFGLLISISFGLLIQIMNQSKETIARTHTLEQAQLGIAQIDRQVRSGNVILDPANESMSTADVGPYYSMRIYTQADGEPRCAQWRVIDHDSDDLGDLEFRTWAPNWLPGRAVDPWVTVARNLVVMDISSTSVPSADDPENWPPFWVDTESTGGTQAQLVRVTLRLQDPGERVGAKPTSVTTVITGRNTVFGYSASSCSEAPPP